MFNIHTSVQEEHHLLKKSYFKYLLSLLLFGSNGIVASHITLSSYEIVLMRTILGSLLLIALFFLTKQKLTFQHHKRDLIYIAVSGTAMGASWMFLYEAYQQVGVSIASLAYYCGPVIIIALSPLFFKEKLTRDKIMGFAAVLCGVFLVNGQVMSDGKTVWGLFCGGMSAVMYAVMVISNKKTKNITGLENTMLQLLFGFVTVALFVGFKQGYAIQIYAEDYAPIFVLGLLNTGVGCYFYFSSIKQLPVQTVAICGYIEPLSAVVLSVIFLNEPMLLPQILGAVLILGGAIFSEGVFQKTFLRRSCLNREVSGKRCIWKN